MNLQKRNLYSGTVLRNRAGLGSLGWTVNQLPINSGWGCSVFFWGYRRIVLGVRLQLVLGNLGVLVVLAVVVVLNIIFT